MKLLAMSLVCMGLAFAQTSQSSQDTTTTMQSKHHGKQVKTNTTSSADRMDENGNVSSETSSTSTKMKAHHGKVKTKTRSTQSGSSDRQ